MERRYDIDWLRVIAIAMLLIYHIAIGFQPWGSLIGFIANDEPIPNLWIPMGMLNVWRIPLLFFVSGMGVFFALQKRNWKQLLGERATRILMPYGFGALVIVPIHVAILLKHYGLPFSYRPSPAHLWFLGNIFAYVLLFIPLFYWLKNRPETSFANTIRKLFSSPAGFLIIALLFEAEALLVQPSPFEMYALTWHGFFLGMVAFLLGFLCVYSGSRFWQNTLKWRWVLFTVALILYAVRLLHYELVGPNELMAIESVAWILTAFGFAHKYLNRPSRLLSYLSAAAYPIYIIHMAALYFFSYLIFPLAWPVWLEFVAVVVLTFVACYALYEWPIKRVSFIRPLFGLKKLDK
ncbi:acyltransferase family protein [Roseivirga thermotolerans]|uniref:acyltransferase family protein n=1 Tax=Roseivirga thermotolerans TaxID=1758176 RepID=UPI00273D2FC7|nr:acyltransferase family protein [Roseivirga thermotolerans]